MNHYIDMFNYQYIQQQAQQHHISQVLEVQKCAKALHDFLDGIDILDFVDVAIGLNNIAVRGDYNLFPTDSVKGRKKKQVGTFEEYRELIKSAKLDFLMDNEPFSKAIILNRNVRNAIAHFNYDFDSDSQRIIFSDKHKGRENAVELYLIDLAILCYENISVLTYLNELLYTLRKIEYVSEGMCIHIKRS